MVTTSDALAGITVIEIASYVSGPYATMLLGDLGATVIKIEPPDGDPFRGWGKVDYSATFGSLNRNKKSVVLDLKEAKGRDDLRRLARRDGPHGAGVRPVEPSERTAGLLFDQRIRQCGSVPRLSGLRHNRPGDGRPPQPSDGKAGPQAD